MAEIKAPSIEATEYASLIAMTNPKSIGKGEASALVLAKSLDGILASNNLKDILQHITGGQPPYICTDSILYTYYSSGYMPAEDGCKIWNDMKSKKRMLPNYDFMEVIRKAESGQIR